ncbi:DNA repair protein RadC [Salibacterium salarium]|uniref:DNA repair protein RadC n=1 Tax=Salibacterium salarium TaxID=284579 RepID=A0A3R9QSU5_9BACI|nr:DNA repair protein RadC [Salibacterium salarium]
MTQPSIMIKNVPVSERPREKMAKNGAESLSNQELLAVLLRTGSQNESVLQLSQRVLYDFDGLVLLKEATVEELQKIKGIGQAKALELRAALELGRRIYTYQEGERYVIRSPEDVSSYVMEDMRFLTQEHFVVLCLNTKNQVIHRQTLFIGSLNSSIAHLNIKNTYTPVLSMFRYIE